VYTLKENNLLNREKEKTLLNISEFCQSKVYELQNVGDCLYAIIILFLFIIIVYNIILLYLLIMLL